MTLATKAANWPVVLRDNALHPRGGDPGRAGSSGSTQVDVKRCQRKALRDAVSLLAQGCLLVVFPEGYPNIDPHYTPKTNPDDMLPFKTGFATIAAVAERRLKTNVALVPIGLHYAKENRRWTARLNVGKAVYLKDFVSRPSLARYMEQRIAELSLLEKSSPSERNGKVA
jgi:putative membrane protein